jgi:glycosyltransferase involved in cell wall biosynthesis
MRIALVAPLVSTIADPYIGGAQALLADLARGLHKRGHHVTLFARAGSSLDGIEIESIAVPENVRPATFSAPTNSASADAGFFAQANIFLELFLQLQQRSDEFDLIHAHAFDWPAYTCSALVNTIPVLHTIHLPALRVHLRRVYANRLCHPQRAGRRRHSVSANRGEKRPPALRGENRA